MDKDIVELNTQAFVGVAFHNKVIFNVVEEDGDFFNTGMSVIQHLKANKNKFVARIIESQSYNSIKCILDDKIIFSDFYMLSNENRETYEDIMHMITDDNNLYHFYILDLDSDMLIIKIPECDEILAICYNNSSDVRDIINKIK